MAPDFKRRNSRYPSPRRVSIANDRIAHAIPNARTTLPERMRIAESSTVPSAVDEITEATRRTCCAHSGRRSNWVLD